MKRFDFICTISIDAETQDEAQLWLDYKTKGLDIYISEIEIQEWDN